jgi:hypothetical protein
MTQLGGTVGRHARSAGNNIYTVLVIIAFVAVVIGIVAVWVRSTQLYPKVGNPFDVTPPAAVTASPTVYV